MAIFTKPRKRSSLSDHSTATDVNHAASTHANSIDKPDAIGDGEKVPSEAARPSPPTGTGPPGGQGPPQPDEYPTGIVFAMIMTSVLSSLFLVALDRTIIATAVPVITDHFHALNDVTWYAGAYLITSCATQLFWGRIYKFYNTKFVCLLSILIFEVGSIICGAAPTSVAFIIGRAIAGIGSASIFSGTTVIIIHTIPLAKRPTYMALLGLTFGVSSVVGPLLGGAFTDHVSWRWCFYINLPIGGAAAFIMLYFLRMKSQHDRTPWREAIVRLDPLGTLVFLPSVICFLLALQWGGITYAWGNARIIVLFILAGVLQIVFWILQVWGKENATIQLRIIRQRSVAAGVVFSMCIGGSLVTMLYWIAIWFQAVKGVSAVHSGIDTIPMVLSLVVASLACGNLVRRTGYYVPAMYVSVVLMAVGAGLITTFTPTTSSGKWIGYQILFGFGLGTGMQQPSLAAQNSLSRADVSVGVSLMFFGQSLGGAVFNAVAQAVFNERLSSGLRNIPGIDVGLILQSGATDLRNHVPADVLPQVLTIYNSALRNAFIVVTAACSFMAIPALLVEMKKLPAKPKPGQGPPGQGPPGQGPQGPPPTDGEKSAA